MMAVDEQTGSKNLKIQSITRKDLDAMGEAKRKFCQDRIAAGQMVIVPEYTPAVERFGRPLDEPRGPFSWLKGKNVQVTLPAGQTIEGKLTDVWQYEIALDVPGSGPVLILKHAVLMIREAQQL